MPGLGKFYVYVQDLNGRTLDLFLPVDTKIEVVKEEISRAWSIPCVCQHLVVGVNVLGDSERLSDHSKFEPKALSITVLVGLDRAVRELENHRDDMRYSAVEVLATAVENGDEKIIIDVSRLLHHPTSYTRLAAVAVLSSAIDEKRIMDALVVRVRDIDASVRLAAVEALSFATKANSRSVFVLCLCFDDSCPCVRTAAVEAFSKMPINEDKQTISSVCWCLQSTRRRVRRAAIRALRNVANKSEKSFILKQLRHFLDHPCASVRQAALSCLPAVMTGDDERMFHLLQPLLADSSPIVRSCAIRVLRLQRLSDTMSLQVEEASNMLRGFDIVSGSSEED